MEANNKAIREALWDILDVVHGVHHEEPTPRSVVDSIEKIVSDADAVPPRNCDRFAKWHEAWDAFVAEYGGPTDPGEPEYHFGVWLFAKEEGKEASNG